MKCFSIDHPQKAVFYLEISLKYVKKRFGEDSKEYLNELKKYEEISSLSAQAVSAFNGF